VREYAFPFAILVKLQNGRLDITACLHQVMHEIHEKCYTTFQNVENSI
jgi:hypothetical protein